MVEPVAGLRGGRLFIHHPMLHIPVVTVVIIPADICQHLPGVFLGDARRFPIGGSRKGRVLLPVKEIVFQCHVTGQNASKAVSGKGSMIYAHLSRSVAVLDGTSAAGTVHRSHEAAGLGLPAGHCTVSIAKGHAVTDDHRFFNIACKPAYIPIIGGYPAVSGAFFDLSFIKQYACEAAYAPAAIHFALGCAIFISAFKRFPNKAAAFAAATHGYIRRAIHKIGVTGIAHQAACACPVTFGFHRSAYMAVLYGNAHSIALRGAADQNTSAFVLVVSPGKRCFYIRVANRQILNQVAAKIPPMQLPCL